MPQTGQSKEAYLLYKKNDQAPSIVNGLELPHEREVPIFDPKETFIGKNDQGIPSQKIKNDRSVAGIRC
jgi:hypothetical protein